MSWDFNVIKTSLDDFVVTSFEEFCKAKGYTVSVHPDIVLKRHSGFLPFKIEGDFLPGLNDKSFITGFELYSDLSETATKTPSKGILKSLFGGKPQPVASALNEEKHDLVLNCSGSDLLEIFMAHLLGLYFVESQGCECYDPQDGIEYKEPKQIEKTINDIVEELKVRLSNGTLKLYDFEEWI
ncbi:MAG: hypothetical protein LBG99_06460 [Propionibacteriaceae bacterium]|nr:hypothetical protein [Propionibacteriaceae bacterium]